MLKIKQLHAEESYDSLVKLSPAEERELIWRKEELQTWNSHQLLEPLQRVYIGSDASTIGWDATHGKQRTGGFWSESERKMHINALELLKAKFAIQAFLEINPPHFLIVLRTDNSTTAAYINKRRNTFHLAQQHHQKSLVVVFRKILPTLGRAYSWGGKYLHRLALKKHSSLKRLVTQQN